MNRRQFLGLCGLTLAAAVTTVGVTVRHVTKQAKVMAYTRGTYSEWQLPGVPP